MRREQEDLVRAARELNSRAHGRSRRGRQVAGLLMAAALVASACGGDADTADEPDDESSTTADAAGDEGTESEEPTAGDTPVEVEELELQMASFLSPGTAQGQAITWWIEELESRTGGNVTVETFWDASLLGAQEIKDGVRDGRAQLGNMTYAYTPSDFPLTQIVEVPFLGNNVPAQATALNELYANNEDFRNEWEGQGIKVLSFVGIPAALTGATEPVETVGWFQGKTVRASGFYVKALEAVGASAAALPVTDVYEAMQRGTIDAYGGLILDVITPLSLHEVGPHIHDAGLGHYANSTWVMALETWESLSPELQGIIEELNAEFPAVLTDAYTETEDAACTTILDSGGSVHIFSEEETQKWADAIGDAPLSDWAALAEGAGVADGEAMYDEFKGYFDAAASGEYSDYRSGMERCVEQQG